MTTTMSGHARTRVRHRPPRGRTTLSRQSGESSSELPRAAAWSHPWQPLAGAALLDRLRATGRARPVVDGGLAAGLRSLIESGIRSVGEAVPVTGGGAAEGSAAGRGDPLVVTRERLAAALSCPLHDPGPGYGRREPSIALACGGLVAALFRQLVTVGAIGDPMDDGMAALSLEERQSGLVSWIEALPSVAREELRAEVERQSRALVARWPALEPSWLPRTDEAMRVALADGAVVLSARVDLAIGRPAELEASVAIVELVSGARRPVHGADRHFAALVETLRHGAPPFVVATYYTSSGELDVEPVTGEILATAARRVVAGIGSMVVRAHDTGSVPDPARFCASCCASPWGTAGFDGDELDTGRPPTRLAS